MESATVVLYPFAGAGHLVSMVELAKLIHIHHPSLHVVIFITPAPFETGSTYEYVNTVSAITPSIKFHCLPTISIPPHFSSDFIDLAFGIPELYNPVVHNTLLAISEKSTIKAVILDFFSNAAFRVSKSLNLPTYYFYTSGASGLCEFLYLPTIHNTTTKNIKDLNIYFDIPGVPPIHASDMPPVMFDRETNMYKNFIDTSSNMAKSCGLIANSFAGFEERALETLRDGKCISNGPTPPVYLIGPLIASGNQVNAGGENECLKWLNLQPCKSVVFLCFGSMGVFKKEQLKEIAIGLEKSGQRFLWVLRDPPPDDNDESIPSATEAGLEAVVSGVPMVAWPLYAEQKMNRVFLVEEMKVAVAVRMSADGFVTAEAVEEKVRELMEGEQGRVVREEVLEMSRRAKGAMKDPLGSSRMDFIKLTQTWTDI